MKISPVTKSTSKANKPQFWDQLNHEIETIGRRAKDNLKKYQLKQYQTLKPTKSHHRSRNPEKTQKLQLDHQINRKKLTELQQQEKNKQRTMRNRLAYLQNGKNRQHKTIQIAKRKFENLVTIRKQSFQEKQALRKRKTSINKQQRSYNVSRIKEVQTARDHKNQTLNNWKKQVNLSASRIRNQSAYNISIIEEQKKKLKLKNIQKANKTKSDLQRSRTIISEINERKKTYCRNNYLSEMKGKIISLKMQKKKNESLYNKFQNQTQQIHSWKSRANQQLAEYKSILNVGKSRRLESQRSEDSRKSTKSFYLTNY